MANFSSGILDVSAAAAFPDATHPQVSIPFTPKFVTVTSEGAATEQIAYSFDGVSVHGVLTVGSVFTTYPMPLAGRPNPCNIWLKRVGGAGTQKAQVQAWT